MLVDDTLEKAADHARAFIDGTDPVQRGGDIRIIAEIGINHNGSPEIAKCLIDIARHCGCDLVKFQKRTPETCVPEHQKQVVRDTPDGPMPYINYKHRIELGAEAYDGVAEHADRMGVPAFSSTWDLPSVDFMEGRSDVGKIPSALITNGPLLRAARAAFDTLIVSTGMSTEAEVERAVEIANPDVIMHSVSSYPTALSDMQLRYIRHLSRRFDAQTGYSGHEIEVYTAGATVALGATWIERHITLDVNAWGSDHSASLTPGRLMELVRVIRGTERALGPADAEEASFERVLAESEREKRNSLRKQ